MLLFSDWRLLESVFIEKSTILNLYHALFKVSFEILLHSSCIIIIVLQKVMFKVSLLRPFDNKTAVDTTFCAVPNFNTLRSVHKTDSIPHFQSSEWSYQLNFTVSTCNFLYFKCPLTISVKFDPLMLIYVLKKKTIF